MANEAGHTFLARLGKTKLRPGGIEATNWLIEQAGISETSQILEVACNMGTTMIQLAERYHCQVTGIDQDRKALEHAKQNIKAHHLEELIQVQAANAMKLPFPDNSFDVLINEAMLTMMPEAGKTKAIAEYYRVLKPGGKLLTHDVRLTEENATVVSELQHAINVRAQPLTEEKWLALFAQAGFQTHDQSGKMSLMNPVGMIRDEGLTGAFKIVKNGLKKENRAQFQKMFQMFQKNKNQLGYIAVVSQKEN